MSTTCNPRLSSTSWPEETCRWLEESNRALSVSADDGATWLPTRLGEDLGKYSFREWTADIRLEPGPHVLKVRATGNDGKTQPDKPLWGIRTAICATAWKPPKSPRPPKSIERHGEECGAGLPA